MKKIFATLSFCALFLFTGCIDRDFDLAETSGEMTIGGEELVVPLGEISEISLGDILKENETIKSNDNGVYQISFSSFGDDPTKYESLSVNGIAIPAITGLTPELNPLKFTFQEMPTQLNMSGVSHKFDVNFPSIGTVVRVQPISVSQGIDIELPSIISGQGTLPSYLVSGLAPITSSYENEVVFDASLSILEQLKKVDWVEFGCDKHPYGAPFEISIDLNGLQDINGGGSLKLRVEFPQGYYLRNENGEDLPSATHNILERDITISEKQRSIKLLVYLHRIDYSDHEFVNGKLEIDDHIKYSYDLSFKICAGNFNLAAMPKFTFESAPEYKDVEVVINHFDLTTFEQELSYSFNGMPSAISVDKIAFTEATNLQFSLKGLDWLSIRDNITDEHISPSIKLALPKCMHFRPHRLLDQTNNTLTATAEELAQGVMLGLSYIDCKAESVKQEMGQLTINETIAATVDLHTLDGHTVLVSSLIPPENFNVSIAISETILNLDIDNTEVSWSQEQSFDFNLDNQIPSIKQDVEIPNLISSIECIEIGKAGSNGEPFAITFSFGTMNGTSFPVEKLYVDVAVNLGKLLRPTERMLSEGIIRKNDNNDYILVIQEEWRPNETRLSKRIEFMALENLPNIIDGKITLNQSFPVTGSVKITSGEDIDLSKVGNAQLDVDVEIDDIEVRTFTGGVNIAVAPEQMVMELGDLGNLGVSINSLSLNPVLRVKLKDNPTGLPIFANLAVKTFDSEGKELQTVTVPTITVAGRGASDIVLSTPRNADKFAGKDVTFVAVDNLSKLLSTGIPAKIAVDMSVATNSSEIYTIDLAAAANGYKFEYQYEVIVPLEFDGDVDISYESAVADLNETFASLADETKGLKVGDVGLIAEFGSTIPFNIVVSAWLVNADGTTEGIDAKLNINECLIKGHNPENGEKSISKIDLDFDLGESKSLAGLRNVDGVRFKFTLYSTDSDTASLSEEQYIDAKLKLRVRDGLTVDIFDLLKNKQ